MERKISLADVQKAVVDAYENYKSTTEGNVDRRVNAADTKAFGISVVLTDGTVINKGDTGVLAPIGEIAKVPTSVVLLTQNSPEELVKKAGVCRCHGKGEKHQKPHLGISHHGVKAVSAIVPQNDADGKWDVMINNFINLAGSAPVLDDKLYETIKKQLADENAIDLIAQAEYTLYDQADIALDLYARLISLQTTTEQLATLGATIAADGRNAKNGQIAFDGAIAANVCAMAYGPHKERKGWAVTVGLPARSGFGGLVLAIMPGFGAIAAYSPLLDANGVSVKGAEAVRYIANTLGLNVFASARVEVEK